MNCTTRTSVPQWIVDKLLSVSLIKSERERMRAGHEDRWTTEYLAEYVSDLVSVHSGIPKVAKQRIVAAFSNPYNTDEDIRTILYM